MSGTYLLLEILGAAALLLWGIRMARTSVMRAHGPRIRQWLPHALNHRFRAILAGAGAAAILQSSTAVALFLASLASLGAVPAAGGLAVMLGADIGSAVVATLLSLNIKGAWPALVLAGYAMHEFYGETSSRGKQRGRLLLGLGMVLIALTFLTQVAGDLTSRNGIRLIVASLADEPIIAVLALGFLTWLAHSSIAILLFVASLITAGVIADNTLIAAAVLGVNLGGGIPAIILTWRQPPAARRIVLGNGLFRLLGVAAGLLFLNTLAPLYQRLPGAPGFRVMLLHILFNLALALICGPLTQQFARLLERLLPTPGGGDPEEFGPLYIPTAPGAVRAALPLSALARETLRISDVVDSMLTRTQGILNAHAECAGQVSQIRRLDDRVDTLYRAIRGYAIELMRSEQPEGDLRRVNALLRYSLSLENVGDIIDKSLLDITAQKAKSQIAFSDDGYAELARLFSFVLETLQLGNEVIMGWRAEMAEALGEREREFQIMANESAERHFERLRLGVSKSLETSSYHLDIVNDLQRINSLFASIARDVTTGRDLQENGL